MDCAGWNKFTGALDLAQHPRRTLDRVMTTPRFNLKVGLSDGLSLKYLKFSFRIPFWKGATKCHKPFHKQKVDQVYILKK